MPPSTPTPYAPTTGDQMPPRIVALARDLMALLLAGDTPNHARLREQFERGGISQIDHTGPGFYVDFGNSDDVPSADPRVAHGGPAAEGYIEIETEDGVEKADAILWLREGRLSSLELISYAPWWPPDAPVRITGATPWRRGAWIW